MRCATLVVPFLLLACTALSAELTGTIVDSTGAALDRALVIIHWDVSGSQTGLKTNQGISAGMQTISDRAGHFHVSVPPGFYDLFVASRAFSPACRKVRVKNGSKTPQLFKLHPDPLVTAELGDSFEGARSK